MQANWSLILNVILLIAVFLAIVHMMRGKRKNNERYQHQPSLGPVNFQDDLEDIVSIRKIEVPEEEQARSNQRIQDNTIQESTSSEDTISSKESIMVFLLAKDGRSLAGYELLQTILAAGLRFGEGHLFHRHQHPNGQGPVLCSLAAATATGVFDLQNIGAFNVKGLCLFMEASGNQTIDEERFTILLETAKQLNEDLDTVLLDEQQRPMTESSLQRYLQRLNINPENQFSSILSEKG